MHDIYILGMAVLARPDGYYDDSDDDEFDGFEFGDSYSSHGGGEYAAVGHIDRGFVPSVASIVKKSNETTSHLSKSESSVGTTLRPETNLSPPPQANTNHNPSGNSVKFSIDTAENGQNASDAVITNGGIDSSLIMSAHQIKGDHHRASTRVFQRGESHPRRRRNQWSPRKRDERTKGQPKQSEESENLRIAVQRGNVVQVKTILENDQYNALMALCAGKAESKGRVEAARVLINRGAVVNSHDKHKMSPLIHACRAGNVALAELLISVNADVNQQDSRGWTPLHYAANQGNHQLVKFLVEANANPEMACNLGDTPASIAYSNNHMALSDWLENVTSASKESGRVDSGLPPQDPLFSETKKDKNEAPPREQDKELPASSCGDLELFLMGEGLKKLIPLFKEHHVEFSDLLTMTDRDLQQMGISEVGIRKKILGSIAEVHKKEWHMPTKALPSDKVLSTMEVAVILSNLARHSAYIKGTTSYLLAHVRTNVDMIGPHPLPNEIDRLNSDLSGAVTAVSSLQEEVLILQTEIKAALSQATPTQTSDAAIPVRRSRALLFVKLIGGIGLLSCVVYVTGKTLFRYLRH